MNKTIKILLLTTFFISFSAHAKEEIIELKDNSAILGVWKMNAESAALHKEKKSLSNTWEFRKDGIIAAKSLDPRLDSISEVKVTYSIENGMIRKQSQPGRSKFENCKVIKLEEKEMVLHCKYLYYFFSK